VSRGRCGCALVGTPDTRLEASPRDRGDQHLGRDPLGLKLDRDVVVLGVETHLLDPVEPFQGSRDLIGSAHSRRARARLLEELDRERHRGCLPALLRPRKGHKEKRDEDEREAEQPGP
jgi:hypothetical protein